MWTPADRASVGDFGAGQASRSAPPIAASQTDREGDSDDRYRSLEPFIPAAEPGGRPRETDVRRVLDASFYVVRTGRQWRHLPIVSAGVVEIRRP